MKYAPRVMQEIKAASVSTESSVSNEGLLDAFVKFIKGYSKDSPGDERNGKPVSSYRWISEQAKEIADTFGNEGWVKSNFHPLKGQLPKETITALSYKGTIPKPAEGIVLGGKLVIKFLTGLKPALTEYSNTLIELEDSALKRIPGQDQLFPVYCEQDVLDLISAHQEIGQPIPEEQQKIIIAKTRSVLSYTTFLVGENQDAGVVVSIGGQWDLLRAKTFTSLAAQIQSDRPFNMPSLTLLNSTKGLQ